MRFQCGHLVVLQDRSQPNGRTLRLAVVILRANDPSNELPLVVLHGGPSGPGGIAGFEMSLARSWAPRLKRDVIVYDQRGAGSSEPALNNVCPEPNRRALELKTVQERQQIWDNNARTCVAALRSKGIDPDTFSSAINAEDLLDLRMALGYRTWDVLGISYGSRLSQEAMVRDPEGVHAAILAGPNPREPSVESEKALTKQRSLERVFAACAAQPTCAAAYPTLPDDFLAVYEELSKTPLMVEIETAGSRSTVPLDGTRFIQSLHGAIPRLLARLPWIVNAAYANSIARLSASPDEIEAGVAIGEAAAIAVLVKRVGDNRDLPDLTGYTPVSGPGVWVPTPPTFAPPQTPFLQFVTPFGYENLARFRPIAPLAVDSRRYLADYLEIKDYGASNSPSRTADQSAIALFWSGSASALWTANVRSLAAPMDILTGARFEALGIAAITNALITTWDSKFHYMFWRPVTAIRAGDTDGNPFTEADQEWTPFIVTPSHPEYIAAHSAVGASTTGFYAVWFGTDNFPLDFKGTGGAIRHYESVDEIHAEESNARVWGGMHWRHSTEVGTRIGTRVGHYTATHLLKPL